VLNQTSYQQENLVMKTTHIEAFFYIADIKENTIANIGNVVSCMKGVVKANVNEHVKSVIDVVYDPQAISSYAIVNSIKNNGARVALVGL